jgi:plasmid stabilization system protein ParE
MKYDVKALRKAEADIRSITTYLYERSPRGAAAWLDAYRQARTRLATSADRCGRAEENEHFDIDVRQALFKTRRGRIYRMLFTIVGNEVRILRVRGPGQAPFIADDLDSLDDE